MAPRHPPLDNDVAKARRRRHSADQARLRSRRRRGVELLSIEVGQREFDLMVRFAGLREDQTTNKTAVTAAIGRLLRLGLGALLDNAVEK